MAWRLVGDVGGTHARFGLSRTGTGRIEEARALRAADHGALAEAALAYLQAVGRPEGLADAVIACAGPVRQGRARFTNLDWDVDEAELARALGLGSSRLINDWQAVATALAAAPAGALLPLAGPGLDTTRPCLTLGADTGFNAALRLASGAVVVGEAGHASFAPLDEVEAALASRLKARHGRASIERVLSGQGLAEIDALIGQAAQPRAPEAVTAALAAGEAQALAAGRLFLDILASVAGDLALTLGAEGGVAVGGGLIGRLAPVLDAARFRERFSDKGRFRDACAALPLVVVTDEALALVGAAALALP